MFDILARDFKTSPLWQKIFLLALLAVLFFHLFIRSGLGFFSKKISQIDQRRDLLFRQVQRSRYLLSDQKVIEQNYTRAESRLLKTVWSETDIKKLMRQALSRQAQRTLSLDFSPQPLKTFPKFFLGSARIQAIVPFAKLYPLLSEWQRMPYVQITSIDYQANYLNLTLEYLYKKEGAINAPANTVVSNKQIRRGQKAPLLGEYKLQGFITTQLTQAIISNKLYSVGSKCGKYIMARDAK